MFEDEAAAIPFPFGLVPYTGDGTGFIANTGSLSPGLPLRTVPSAEVGPASILERSASRLLAAFCGGCSAIFCNPTSRSLSASPLARHD